MSQTEVELRKLSNSVKRGDFDDGAVLQIVVPSMDDPSYRPLLPYTLPPITRHGFFHQRDRILLSTARYESMWSSALFIAISKMASLAWKMESDIELRRKAAQRFLANAGAGSQFGWIPFVQKHLQAFLCSSKAVVEIERETSAYGSQIKNIHHLDPLRCQLTGDPQIPVLYQDRQGWIHEMKWWQCEVFSDLPDATAEEGTGLCGAERAYRSVLKLAAIDQYLYDKVTGRRPLAIYIVEGLSTRKLKDMVDSDKAESERKSFINYMGATLGGVTSDNGIKLVTIPLAELPDRFNRKEELDIALLNYANALGLDPQDLQPLTGQQLGAGAQSQVLHDKAQGRGLMMWRQQWVHFMNQLVLDDKTQFVWSEKDLRDEMSRAVVADTRAKTRAQQIASGEITAEQARNLAVDSEDLPAEFLVEDITAGGAVTDSENPDKKSEKPEATEDTSDPTEKAEKAISDVDDLWDEELARAMRLYKKVRNA